MVTAEMVRRVFAGTAHPKSDFWARADGDIDAVEYARRIDARWAREERLAAAVGPRPVAVTPARPHRLPGLVRRVLAAASRL